MSLVLGVSSHPLPAYSRHFRAVFDSRSLLLNRTETLATHTNQAVSSLANAGFQNRGVCLQAFPSFPSPSPSFIFWLSFHFSRGQNRKSPSPVFLCSKTKRRLVVLFFRTEYSKQKFVFHYFKAIFDTSFRPLQSFSGKWNWFVQMVNAISGAKFTSPEFCVPFA